MKGTFLSSVLFCLLLSACCSHTPVGSIQDVDKRAEKLKKEILSTKDEIKIPGTSYYVSSSMGSDENDGLSPQRPIKTLDKANSLDLLPGDGVLFLRGDVFRGHVKARKGCTYAAYGKGEKPRIYGSPFDAAKQGSWTLTARENVWVYSKPLFNDVGTLVMDSTITAMKVMMNKKENGSTVHIETGRPFFSYMDLDRDLDFYHDYKESGNIYLCSTKGNPADRFSSIEVLEKGNVVAGADDVRVDNLAIMYGGSHGVGSGTITSMEVTNCVFGWIGGSILGEGLYGRGHPTRFGNAIEVYGGCGHYLVENCWIYQIYDTGITHQYSSSDDLDIIQRDITYRGNLVEDCTWLLEYYLAKGTKDSSIRYIGNVLYEDNILRRAGQGWGCQRPDHGVASAIQSWGDWNKAEHFIIRNNIFDRSLDHLVDLGAAQAEWIPTLSGNTFIQKRLSKGAKMGVPYTSFPFDETFAENIKSILGEDSGTFIFE